MKSTKLTKREFARAMEFGFGRVQLHVRDHGDAGMESVIERAVLMDLVYDSQFEGSRASWVFRILCNSRRLDQYSQFLLENIGDKDSTLLDLCHQLTLARHFFEYGYHNFRPCIIDLSKRLLDSNDEVQTAAEALIDTCGMHGFKFALREICRKNAGELDDWNCTILADYASGAEIPTERCIEELQKEFPDTSRFQNALKRFKQDKPYQNRPAPTLTDALNCIKSSKTFRNKYILRKFGQLATKEELAAVYDIFKMTENKYKQFACLQVFDERELPEITGKLIAIMDSNSWSLKRVCANALNNSCHSEIRKKALALLAEAPSRDIPLALTMLEKNYRSADAPRICQALNRLTEQFHSHYAGLELKTIAKRTDDRTLRNCFLFLYENVRETYCRVAYVKIMQRWGLCPKEILMECQWDAGSETREFSRSELAKGKLSILD